MDAIFLVPQTKVGVDTRITQRGQVSVLNNMLTRTIHHYLHHGQNLIGIVTGKPRSGKTYSTMTICLEIDPSFNIDNIVFSASEFMSLLSSGKLKEGSVILWDEGGTAKSMSSREWFGLINKSINYVLQTWGHRNIGLFITVPDFHFIDSNTRKLCNLHIHTIKKNERKGIVTAKVHYTSPMKDDIKRVRPRYDIGSRRYMTEWVEIAKPPVKLYHAYEIKKKEFTDSLNKDILADIKGLEQKESTNKNKNLKDDVLVDMGWDLLKDRIKVTHTNKRSLSHYIVRRELGVPVDRAMFIRDRILARSYDTSYPPKPADPDIQTEQNPLGVVNADSII